MSSKGFFIYADTQKLVDALNFEQRGRLFTALYADHAGQPLPELDAVTNMALIAILNGTHRIRESYERRAEIARQNGKRGGKKNNDAPPQDENPVGFSETQKTQSPPVAPSRPQSGQTKLNQTKLSQANNSFIHTDKSVCIVDGKPSPPPCPHKKIIALYHEKLPELPRVKVWGEQRERNLQARWRERYKEGKYKTEAEGLEYWGNLFEHVGKSSFLTGKTNNKNGRPFLASLDWIIRTESFARIIEGKYDD